MDLSLLSTLNRKTEYPEMVKILEFLKLWAPKGVQVIPHIVAFTNQSYKRTWVGDEFSESERSVLITFKSAFNHVRVDGQFYIFWLEFAIGPQKGPHGVATKDPFAHAMILILQRSSTSGDNCFIFNPSFSPQPERLLFLKPAGVRACIGMLPKSFKLFFWSLSFPDDGESCRPNCLRFIVEFFKDQQILSLFQPFPR
jgi:hypothetical protein